MTEREKGIAAMVRASDFLNPEYVAACGTVTTAHLLGVVREEVARQGLAMPGGLEADLRAVLGADEAEHSRELPLGMLLVQAMDLHLTWPLVDSRGWAAALVARGDSAMRVLKRLQAEGRAAFREAGGEKLARMREG